MRIGAILTLLGSAFVTLSIMAAPTVGTMSAEVRDANERIDIDKTIAALQRLGINTYYYLIWQHKNDWDDLPEFCRRARELNIEVWPYIVPWSETPPHKPRGWGFSEPYRTDYIKWAEAIARLSLEHPNIVGWVIDDFYDNTTEGRFTPNYVRRMVTTAKRINPRLKFFPLMYFQTPWAEFTKRFAGIVDGVVICYPKSELGVQNALLYLKDKRHGPSAMIMLPRHHGAMRGDGARVGFEVNISDPEYAWMTFYYDVTDAVESNTSLIHARIRIDRRIVWESPTEGKMRDGVIEVDLRPFVTRRGRIRVDFELVTERTGVPEQLPVIVRFDDVRIWGVGRHPERFAADLDFREREMGKFRITTTPGSPGNERFRLPVVLMPTGEGPQYEKRYDQPGTPAAVAEKVRMCFQLMEEGLIDGVVTYRLPLNPNGPMFQMVRREFDAFNRSQMRK